MIIGTAGHIDGHGKTALVKALTEIDCDRLKEEKARGITIDLGFAYLPIAHGQVLGFVDVPGHERFVHTMLAGASGIDFALLTVAANDGVKPQTLEHLAIFDLLGTERGVVVTKADLATPERLAAVISQIRAATAGTVLEDADILPVSAVTGQGVDKLRAYLADAATDTPDRSAEARFRLAVDRVFTLAGVEVVVTGTVVSGLVHVGDHVQVSPSGLMARVRSLMPRTGPSKSVGRATGAHSIYRARTYPRMRSVAVTSSSKPTCVRPRIGSMRSCACCPASKNPSANGSLCACTTRQPKSEHTSSCSTEQSDSNPALLPKSSWCSTGRSLPLCQTGLSSGTSRRSGRSAAAGSSICDLRRGEDVRRRDECSGQLWQSGIRWPHSRLCWQRHPLRRISHSSRGIAPSLLRRRSGSSQSWNSSF